MTIDKKRDKKVHRSINYVIHIVYYNLMPVEDYNLFLNDNLLAKQLVCEME